MRSVSPWAVTMFALGCSFDASGIAESSAAGPGAGSSTGGPGSSGAGPGSSSSSGEAVTTGGEGTGSVGSSGAVEPGTTGGPGTSGSMTTEPGTTTTTGPEPGTSTSGAPDSTGPVDESTTTGAPVCPQPYTQIVLVKDASVMAPMGKFMSGMGEGMVAYSLEAEQGSVTFSFELPCAAQVAVWARVQDLDSGVHMNNDPDSFYPHVDGLAEAGWPYGCQTEGLQDGYHWLPVRMGTIGDQCDQFADLRPQLAAGVHTISLRNREAQAGNAVAAVARVLVTSDLGYVPKLPD